MHVSDVDARASDSYHVFLLRLWREKDGPWRASLQTADAVTAQRFADLDALATFLATAAFTSTDVDTFQAGDTT